MINKHRNSAGKEKLLIEDLSAVVHDDKYLIFAVDPPKFVEHGNFRDKP